MITLNIDSLDESNVERLFKILKVLFGDDFKVVSFTMKLGWGSGMYTTISIYSKTYTLAYGGFVKLNYDTKSKFQLVCEEKKIEFLVIPCPI